MTIRLARIRLQIAEIAIHSERRPAAAAAAIAAAVVDLVAASMVARQQTQEDLAQVERRLTPTPLGTQATTHSRQAVPRPTRRRPRTTCRR